MKIVFARISDNVLDAEDWPIAKLVIADGEVTAQAQYKPGVYGFESFVGWTVEQLAAWSRFDGTGTHPEQYNELAEAELGDDGEVVPGTFHDFWAKEEIAS